MRIVRVVDVIRMVMLVGRVCVRMHMGLGMLEMLVLGLQGAK